MTHYKNVLSLNLKEESDKNLGKSSLKSPREHQLEAHRKMTKFFLNEEKKAGILVLPTGAGKTYAAVYWLLKNVISKNKKVLWLADQSFLLEQAREEFRESILEVDKTRREVVNIRTVSGSDKHGNPNQISISDDILLITSQTAISNWEYPYDTPFKQFIEHNAKSNGLFIVYDEAHHTPAFGRRNLLIGGSENRTGIIQKFPKTNLLGLTATPTYTDRNQRGWLWEIFKGGIIHEVAKNILENRGILASPVFIQEKTNFNLVLSDSDIDKVLFKHQEIPAHIIEELAKNEERNDFIAKYYCDNIDEFGKTIIFLDRWYQCRTVENYINRKAGKKIAASVFSYVDMAKKIDYINNRTANENERNLELFKTNELKVLINVKMLTEGVDVPDVKTVFLTRDTNSNILFTQMIGRALRGKNAGGNKSTANVVLFTDNWNRHILFASSRFLGGKEDNEIKERGFRPFELIRIDLLDKLELEYQNQNYETSIFDLLPIGWYVVCYTDTILEENEDNEIEKVTESFIENVIVLTKEVRIFNHYIDEYNEKNKNVIWEMEELDFEKAEELIKIFLENNKYTLNKVTISKLIQLSRHLGQNNTIPEYYTFEQKNEVNMRGIVIHIRNENLGRDASENYLEHKYHSSENPFLKVLFPTYEDFYRAYAYEDNVYRKQKKGIAKISEASQKIEVTRLATEEVRKLVFSRDNHKCLCCGKSNNLQIDHIVSFKENEPDDDNPELYQTLCGVCNREKSSNSYNYRITNYDNNKMSLKNVQSTNTEDPIYYITRLINCYYKTSAVQKDRVEAINRGNSIWKLKIKYGTNPVENILKEKQNLMDIIRKEGYSLKDIQIENH